MTTTTRHKAAERALARAAQVHDAESFAEAIADYCSELIAAERRAAVERIRTAISFVPFPTSEGAIYGKSVEQYASRVLAILDEEAAR